MRCFPERKKHQPVGDKLNILVGSAQNAGFTVDHEVLCTPEN